MRAPLSIFRRLPWVLREISRALFSDFRSPAFGHGTGRLKKAVRAHLRDHPAVDSWRAGDRGEGGDGATIVSLTG